MKENPVLGQIYVQGWAGCFTSQVWPARKQNGTEKVQKFWSDV